MEIGEATEQALLAHAERQTKALESLRTFAVVWSLLAAVGLLIALIAIVGAARA